MRENREPKKHGLKILPEYYDAVASGQKNFELRKDDRDYEVGDLVKLKEYKDGHFTEREFGPLKIKYILRGCPEYGLQDGYCILGF